MAEGSWKKQYTTLHIVVAAFIVYCLCGNTYGVMVYPFDTFSPYGTPEPNLDLRVEVSQQNDFAWFTLFNDSPIQSSMAQIYFADNGNLLTDDYSIVDGCGVDFSLGARPHNLPGRERVPLWYDTAEITGFAARNPAPHRGINPGEQLRIGLGLSDGVDIFEAMLSGTLRIGSHVIALPDGGSATVATRLGPVPEPSTAAILLMGTIWFLPRRFITRVGRYHTGRR